VANSTHSHRHTIWPLDRGVSQSVANWRLTWLAGKCGANLYMIGNGRGYVVDHCRDDAFRFDDHLEAEAYYREVVRRREELLRQVAKARRDSFREISCERCGRLFRTAG
jgi:hypothetical protein